MKLRGRRYCIPTAPSPRPGPSRFLDTPHPASITMSQSLAPERARKYKEEPAPGAAQRMVSFASASVPCRPPSVASLDPPSPVALPQQQQQQHDDDDDDAVLHHHRRRRRRDLDGSAECATTRTPPTPPTRTRTVSSRRVACSSRLCTASRTLARSLAPGRPPPAHALLATWYGPLPPPAKQPWPRATGDPNRAPARRVAPGERRPGPAPVAPPPDTALRSAILATP